jgi:hypothetical protein
MNLTSQTLDRLVTSLTDSVRDQTKNELNIKPSKNGFLVEERITDSNGDVVDVGDLYCFESQSTLSEFIRDYYSKPTT